jgi:phosphohistidine phosphatase
MMLIYLLRHGQAEQRSYADSTRRLTDSGREEARSVACQFLERKLVLDHAWCSPYTRARQTAEEFIAIVQSDLVPENGEWLTPENRARDVLAILADSDAQHVLLVSHNPLVSELNALLTEGDISERHILGTSELVCIEADPPAPGTGSLQFVLKP